MIPWAGSLPLSVLWWPFSRDSSARTSRSAPSWTRHRGLSLLAITASCFASSGCFTLGPRVETRFVIVHQGQPIQVLDNRTVRGRRIGDDAVATQDIGGWMAMPRDHFDALMRAATLNTQPETP